MKNWAGVIKGITMLTQFGISFITPLLLCLGLCVWLTQSLGFGGWVFIPGFFFGLGSSFTVAYKTFMHVIKKDKEEEKQKKKKVFYNRHL